MDVLKIDNDADEKLPLVSLKLAINSIANIPRENNAETFILNVYYDNKLLKPIGSKSEKIHVEPISKFETEPENDQTIPLDLNYNLIVQSNSFQDLDTLIDSPLFFVIRRYLNEKGNIRSEDVENVEKIDKKSSKEVQIIKTKKKLTKKGSKGSEQITDEGKEIKKSKQKDITKKNDKKSSLSDISFGQFSMSGETITLGYGHLELFHIIKSESKDFEETVYLYPEKVSLLNKTLAININVHVYENSIFESGNAPINMATFTLESIFNIPKNLDVQGLSATVDVFINAKDVSGNKTLFSFSDGNLSTFQENENQYKRWSSLPNVKGLSTRTNQQLETTLTGIYDLDLTSLNKIDKNNKIFVFNSLHRAFIYHASHANFIEFLCQTTDHLLVEVNFKIEGKDEAEAYRGYADLSPILYPGMKLGRFCVSLTKDVVASKSEGSRKSESKRRTKTRISKQGEYSRENLDLRSFYKSQLYLIFEIELFLPITEVQGIKQESR